VQQLHKVRMHRLHPTLLLLWQPSVGISQTRNRNAVPRRFNVKKPRFVIQSEITTPGSRGLLELTLHIALTNKKKVVEEAFRYGGPKDTRVNRHTPPLLKAALSCQEQSHLHTVMVCFSVNTGNEICKDVG